MKLSHKLSLMMVACLIALPSYAAKDPKKNAIKARQGEMQLRAFNAGPLFAMAKGKMPYDATKAAKYAGNLELLLKLDNKRAWMSGTDNEAYAGDTTATPNIWTTYPEIGKYGKKYVTAVNELNAAAGKGLKPLRSKIGALGKSCKGCHDEFREKK